MVVDDAEVVVVVVDEEAPVVLVDDGAVVGVVVGVGATYGVVSPASVAWLAVGPAVNVVQVRAAVQLLIAVASADPVRGWGKPLTSVAGRKVAVTIFRPMAVMRSEPLSVSGGSLS